MTEDKLDKLIKQVEVLNEFLGNQQEHVFSIMRQIDELFTKIENINCYVGETSIIIEKCIRESK